MKCSFQVIMFFTLDLITSHMTLLCSCKRIFSLLAFVLDLQQALVPWDTLNLAHCANYLWNEAHSHNHQFRSGVEIELGIG